MDWLCAARQTRLFLNAFLLNILFAFGYEEGPAIGNRQGTGVGDVQKPGYFSVVQNTAEINFSFIEIQVWKIHLNVEKVMFVKQ